MATSYSDKQQLIHTYIVENTQQKITATKMREVFTRLLEYTSEHQIDNGRLHSTVAKNQPVDQRIGVAKNDTIEQLHGLPLSPALTLVMLEQEIEDLRTQINGTSPPSPIPPGVICMWSGSRAPDGWALCDGSAGRPNLLGKFIRGHNPVDSNSHSGTHSDLLAGHTIPPGTPTDGTIAGEPNVILGRSNIPTHVHEA